MPAIAPSQLAHSELALNRCTFEHPLFNRFPDVLFRPAEADGVPVMVIPLGSSTAAFPLHSLKIELRLGNESPDGRMLALIARSLDFVAGLRIGDPLPVEVLDGAASWQPSPRHQEVAASRMKLQLISQLGASQAIDWGKATPQAVLAAVAGPGIWLPLQSAYIEVAARCGVPDVAAAVRLSEEAVYELGFIEALRDRLLRRVVWLMERLQRLGTGLANNLSGAELLSRVRRLTGIGIGKIAARFDDLDRETAVVLDMLQSLEIRRVLIRQRRDWLYCSLRGWDPILAAWEASSFDWSDGTWPLLGRTYRFLAPRYMPMQEWQVISRANWNGGAIGPRMVW